VSASPFSKVFNIRSFAILSDFDLRVSDFKSSDFKSGVLRATR